MNPRLAKEFRSLLFPWSVVAIAGAGYLALNVSQGGVWGFISGAAGFAFLAGCLLLAALPFASEFQLRTLPLLLGQPLERFQIWKEKFFAATVSIICLAVVHAGFMAVANASNLAWGKEFPFADVLPVLGFIVVTICSTAFFALSARSVVGGMVFAGASQLLIMSVVTGIIFTSYKLLGRSLEEPDINRAPILITYVGMGAIYSAFLLWLGWRVFAKLEVRDGSTSAELRLPNWLSSNAMSALLRCQPTGPTRNLIRKEVMLQKPMFTIAVVLVVCWAVTRGLLFLDPAHQKTYVVIFGALTVIQIVIVSLLTGCVSLGDEKALGLSAWHLTLPVSTRRQWLVKLAVAALTIAVLGIGVPLLLACLSFAGDEIGLAICFKDGNGIGPLLILLGAMLAVGILSFWCMVFLSNAVRAALNTILVLIGIGGCVQLAFSLSSLYFGTGFQAVLVASFSNYFRLSPDYLLEHEACCIGFVVVPVLAVALFQSLAQFRRAQAQPLTMLKCLALIGLIAFLSTSWCADLLKSIRSQIFLNESEFGDALTLLPQFSNQVSSGKPWVVTPQKLAQTGRLSERTKAWIRGSTITIYPERSRSVAQIDFANQRHARIVLPFRAVPPLKESP